MAFNFSIFWDADTIPRCKVTKSFDCDLPVSYVAFALMFILLLPFAFVSTCLIKNWAITHAREYSSGASYCINFIIFIVILYFYFYCFNFPFHDHQLDSVSCLVANTSDLYIMSVSLFFYTVSRVLVLFKAKFANIAYWISKTFSIYYVCAAVVKFILVYIDIPYNMRKNLFSNAGIYYKYVIEPSEYIIDCISFFILSQFFLFSGVEILVPKGLILRLKIALFLMALMEINAIILREYQASIPISRYIFAANRNKYSWIFTVIFFGHRFPIDYVILYIIYTMTIQSFKTEEDENYMKVLNDTFESL